jgi:hypothetical protein
VLVYADHPIHCAKAFEATVEQYPTTRIRDDGTQAANKKAVERPH